MIRYNDETDNLIENNYLKYAYMYSENIFLIGDCSNDRILREYFYNNNIIITGRIGYEEKNKITKFFKNISIKGYKNSARDLFLITSLDIEENLKIINILNNIGIKKEQIISSGNFLLDILAEYQCFYRIPSCIYKIPRYAGFDLVDTCNLRCSTCMRNEDRGTSEKMEYDVFTRCLDKLCRLGIKSVEMHMKTEPFLHPQIVEFCDEVKKRNMVFTLSTNLAIPGIGEKAKKVADMMTKDDFMVISISGLTQEVYEINHKGGKIENVIDNLIVLASTSGYKKNIILRLLQFDYNVGEIPRVAELAKKLGISYQIMRAGGNPVKKQLLFQELRPLDFTLQDYSHAMNKLKYCSWIFEGSFVINHKGNLNLCCNCDVVPTHNLGSFLTQDISAIQLKRFLHPVCGRCTKGRVSVNKNLDNIIAINNVVKEGIEAQMLKNDLKLDLFIENYNLKIISDYFLFNGVNNMGER